ncbi:hypothetical protein [Clostridium thermobutyricum]|uniref:hypothetical protein n=1 Tax=Clostridium thermobutyricum TaxID=29372 RepID=UPI0009ACBED2|nr:hypothetical protein [Clostridium thermobutyricum]
MKNRKKKGSTLVTVLAVSLIFMALSGVILKSISSTMKLNTNQKEIEDLRYAAESGLELARSHFESGNMSIDTRDSSLASQEEKNLDNILSTKDSGGIVDKVDIYMDTKNGKDIIKSVAKHVNGTTTELAMINYRKIASGHNTDIFDHGLVAGSGGVIINNGGVLNGTASSISTGKPLVNAGTGNTQLGSIEENTIGSLSFQNWNNKKDTITLREDWNFYNGNYENGQKINITNVELTFSNNELKVDGSSEEIKTYIKNLVKEPVVKIQIKGLKIEHEMTIYLVNANNLNINSAGSMMINNTAIICDGEISVTGAKATNGVYYDGALHLSNSTIFGEKVTIDKGSSIHMAYQPSKDNGFGLLEEDEENLLNDMLGTLLPNWSSGGQEGNNSEKIEFIENTFNNE